jgi:hypothetical protein
MKALQIAMATIGLMAAYSMTADAQGETAVPFLLISPSSEANGMGGTSIALQRFDPTGSIFCPAQIGFSALSTNVRVGFYPTTTGMLTEYNLAGLSYSAWAVSAGVLLNDFVDLPLRIGLGMAYHRVELDLGTFQVTGEAGPETIGTFEAYENASGFTMGVGIEYLLRFGFGYTFRSVESHLSPIGTEAEKGAADAHENAYDCSFLLEAPLVTIIEEIAGGDVGFGSGLRPFLGVSSGIGWNNMGDELVYIDPAQADPFPRSARAGIAVRGGVRMKQAADWELLSAAWTREAQDLLVVRKEDGTWEYQSGLGDIEFSTNVLQGKLTEKVGLRSGWQIQAAEVFTLRQGSVEGPGAYDTWGYTIQLAGLMKGIALIVGSDAPGWLLFARDHIDVQYHFAEYEVGPGHSRVPSYNGLTLALRVWPW